MKLLKVLVLMLAIIYTTKSQAQSNQEKAIEMAHQAIRLMDEGNLDESIKLLNEASTLYPESFDIRYEIALAHYMKKDYNTCIELLEEMKDHREAGDVLFQLLGNAYDVTGHADKALETYHSGMKKFPQSGKLYLEAGVVAMTEKRYNEAIDYWEKGIKVEPNYASNYYWLAKIFANSEEHIWSFLYSEIFMNLELNSPRTEEISQLMYQNYLDSYQVTSDSSGEYKMTKRGFVIELKKKKDFKKNMINGRILPFEGIYATNYTLATIHFTQGIGIQDIILARQKMVEIWFEKSTGTYENQLLNRQKEIMKAGVFEAYSYWLVSQGNPDAFESWYQSHQEDFDRFASWIQENPINLKPEQLYSRPDYF